MISEEIKVFGGDKRDRTADLLNAMDCPRAVGVLRAAHREKLLISNAFSVSRGSNTVELCCFCVLDWLFYYTWSWRDFQAPPRLFCLFFFHHADEFVKTGAFGVGHFHCGFCGDFSRFPRGINLVPIRGECQCGSA